MTRIDSLTDEQWGAVHHARRQWLRVGTCTDPADRPVAEAAFASLFSYFGHPAPCVLWADGPTAAAFLIAEKRTRGQLGGRLRTIVDRLRNSLRTDLAATRRTSLEDSLRVTLGESLRASLGASLRSSLGTSLRASLGPSLWNRVGPTLHPSLRAILKTNLPGNLGDELDWGQEHAYWLGHDVTCRDVVGIAYTDEQSAQLAVWERLVRSCGWWAPFEGLVIACERPRVIRMDDGDVIHCEDGPAVECRDGHRVYAWHGTRVPAEWIEQRSTLDPATALTWENVEQRRCAAEIIGWHRVLELLDARTVDQDVDHSVGRLVEVELPGAGLERFLVVRCGTGRTFALPVPPQMQTALEANAWTYGVEPELVRHLEVRT